MSFSILNPHFRTAFVDILYWKSWLFVRIWLTLFLKKLTFWAKNQLLSCGKIHQVWPVLHQTLGQKCRFSACFARLEERQTFGGQTLHWSVNPFISEEKGMIRRFRVVTVWQFKICRNLVGCPRKSGSILPKNSYYRSKKHHPLWFDFGPLWVETESFCEGKLIIYKYYKVTNLRLL